MRISHLQTHTSVRSYNNFAHHLWDQSTGTTQTPQANSILEITPVSVCYNEAGPTIKQAHAHA